MMEEVVRSRTETQLRRNANPLPTKPLPKKAAPRKQSKPSVAAKKTPAGTDKTKKYTAELRGLKSKRKKKDSSGPKSLKTTVSSLNTSVWLRHTLPLRLPYCPQVGDRVYYYPWMHKLVYECIKKRRLATHKGVSEEAQQPWSTQQNLGFNTADHTKELFVVRSIKYEIITPRIKSSNRLAILKLDSLERTPQISITIQ
ncbi:hypothetical protein RvY_10475-2 [Ramazzottius varieornatus]|uniref:Uncharacterized protein n=1 Tax=Ramazzottius varieornatus TaxID=947166 RepID=A0A1D1VCV7_RAMVA|nr:hypothetical protein RvY_10475-2 [Ramazzottius varieornatus]